MSDCLSRDQIEAYLIGDFSKTDEKAVAKHLDECSRCREFAEAHRSDSNISTDAPRKAGETVPKTVDYSTGKSDTDSAEGPNLSIPGYEILQEIHRGGQGIVYKAVQKSTKRTVALKILLQGAYASTRQRLRFEREVDLVASLRHPNIVTIFDSGTTPEGLHYFAMEYLHGETLDRHMRFGSVRTLADRLRLFTKICAAVNYAHQRGVTHRDLKPSNIRIDSNGEPHLLDFGLAKSAGPEWRDDGRPVTMTGEFMGTLAYASPEQTKGDPSLIDIRTDVYSLGVILYEMLTGQFPYRVRGHMADILKAIAETPPEPASSWFRKSAAEADSSASLAERIDDQLDAIVLKALAKEKERRYQSAGALAEDVEHYLAGEPIQARPPSIAFLMRTWLKQNFRDVSAIIWTVTVGALAGLAPVGVFLLVFDGILQGTSSAYARFPSVAAPKLVALNLAMPEWFISGLLFLGAVFFFGMGMFLSLLIRPRNRWADALSGLIAGLIAGVVAFTTCIGPTVGFALTVQPTIGDLNLLGAGYSTRERVPPARAAHAETSRHPQDLLLERYPDLSAVPEAQRASLLSPGKIVSDMIVGSFLAVWLGLPLTMFVCSLFGVCETLAAGYLLRRSPWNWRMPFSYVELTLPTSLFLFSLVPWLTIPIFGDEFESGAETLFVLLWCGLTSCAVIFNWPWPIRILIPVTFMFEIGFLWHTGDFALWQDKSIAAAGLIPLAILLAGAYRAGKLSAKAENHRALRAFRDARSQ